MDHVETAISGAIELKGTIRELISAIENAHSDNEIIQAIEKVHQSL